ncbi:MAG: hypothetical protein OXM61_17120 [Candidatus Poribacteria bacterium]|nr:hypothetical protein [Candidatus Poribacteria bacterium]
MTDKNNGILHQNSSDSVERNGFWCLGIRPSEIDKTLSANPWCENIIAYFKRSIQNQNQYIERGNPVFAADLFYQVLGMLLSVPHSDIEETTVFNITEYVLNLQDRNGSFGFYPTNPQTEIAKILKNRTLPTDVYATFYALGILNMLNVELAENQLDKIINWLSEFQAPSGWYYNLDWANTEEHCKLQNEVTLQTLCAASLYNFLDVEKDWIPILSAIEEGLAELLYMGPVQQCLQTWDILTCGKPLTGQMMSTVEDFISDHYDVENGGFYEYLRERAKQLAGSGGTYTARYKYDQCTPHVCSSYNALQMLSLLLPYSTTLCDFWQANRMNISDFFANQAPASDDGFGIAVRIAQYTEPFGPASTPLETLMILASSAMIEHLDEIWDQSQKC